MDIEILLVGHSYLDRLLRFVEKSNKDIEEVLDVSRPIHCAVKSGKSILDLKQDLGVLTIVPDVLLIELGIVDLYWSSLDPEQLAVKLVSDATRTDRTCVPKAIVICLPAPVTRITGSVRSIEEIHRRIDLYSRMLHTLTSDLPNVMLFEHLLKGNWTSDKLHPRDNRLYGNSIKDALTLAYSRISNWPSLYPIQCNRTDRRQALVAAGRSYVQHLIAVKDFHYKILVISSLKLHW